MEGAQLRDTQADMQTDSLGRDGARKQGMWKSGTRERGWCGAGTLSRSSRRAG